MRYKNHQHATIKCFFFSSQFYCLFFSFGLITVYSSDVACARDEMFILCAAVTTMQNNNESHIHGRIYAY